jgi:hypothetical protein
MTNVPCMSLSHSITDSRLCGGGDLIVKVLRSVPSSSSYSIVISLFPRDLGHCTISTDVSELHPLLTHHPHMLPPSDVTYFMMKKSTVFTLDYNQQEEEIPKTASDTEIFAVSFISSRVSDGAVGWGTELQARTWRVRFPMESLT